LISTHYVAWAVERESAEGTTAEKLLRATSFPCFAIVSVENPSRPVVLSKIEGQFPANYVSEFLAAQFEPIRQVDPRQEELENERRLRMMQDLELQAAEKVLEERRKNEENKRIEEKKKLELRDANRKAKIQAVGEEAEGEEAVLVSFRMPNGSKVERKFDKRRSIQVLYDFLEIQDVCGVEILFGFPAVILTDKNVSLEEAGLFPKALVIVRKIEDN
jgi:FAS-associated factor 2